MQTAGFPNLFFPGGPHAAAGNNPRYNGDQVDFVTDVLVHARARSAHDVVEVTAEAEERWTAMIDRAAAETPFGTIGQYVGGNIPGKPKRYLLNAGGRPKLFKEIARVKATDYAAFATPRASPVAARAQRARYMRVRSHACRRRLLDPGRVAASPADLTAAESAGFSSYWVAAGRADRRTSPCAVPGRSTPGRPMEASATAVICHRDAASAHAGRRCPQPPERSSASRLVVGIARRPSAPPSNRSLRLARGVKPVRRHARLPAIAR